MSQMAHRKQLETTDLEFFLAAYRESTGRYVVEANPSERPDFICRINNNREVGIELTKIVREPETAFWQRILYGRDYLDASDLPEKIIGVIEKKSPKCSEATWQTPDDTILVIQLMDCPFSAVHSLISERWTDDICKSSGFSEIWLADYSELDAYGAIELCALFPASLAGYYQREKGKPYG